MENCGDYYEGDEWGGEIQWGKQERRAGKGGMGWGGSRAKKALTDRKKTKEGSTLFRWEFSCRQECAGQEMTSLLKNLPGQKHTMEGEGWFGFLVGRGVFDIPQPPVVLKNQEGWVSQMPPIVSEFGVLRKHCYVEKRSGSEGLAANP